MEVAGAADTDEIRERILTGYKDGKPFTPYVPTVALPPHPGRVLDFGCGLGRNFPYLTQMSRSVTGFDLPPMIERCRAAAVVPVERLTSDWDALRTDAFDLIFASLVLQHVEAGPMRAFLADFARMSPSVYLLTRTRTDFGEQLLEVVHDMQLFDASECVEVDHDPVTHQLRVLGRMGFDEARAIADERHFEVLLASHR
jgi:SAM-dependent methyltransferase